MAALSPLSINALASVHPTLVAELKEFSLWYDIHVLNGVRTQEEEDAYVKSGKSETEHSMHLIQADGYGHAADICPTPQEWDTSPPANLTKYEVECIGMLFAFKGWCAAKGIKIRIGADWNDENKWRDNKFNDLDHVELPNG